MSFFAIFGHNNAIPKHFFRERDSSSRNARKHAIKTRFWMESGVA